MSPLPFSTCCNGCHCTVCVMFQYFFFSFFYKLWCFWLRCQFYFGLCVTGFTITLYQFWILFRSFCYITGWQCRVYRCDAWCCGKTIVSIEVLQWTLFGVFLPCRFMDAVPISFYLLHTSPDIHPFVYLNLFNSFKHALWLIKCSNYLLKS